MNYKSFIVKTHVNILPAMIVNEGAEAIVNKCEIKGNKNHLTIGIYSGKKYVVQYLRNFM